VAGGTHAAGIEDGGEIGGIVDEAELDEPAFVELHDGEGFVLALLFGLGSAIGEAKGVGDEGGEFEGAGLVIGSAIEDFGAAGFAFVAVEVNGDHALTAVGAGDVVATGDGGGIAGIAAGADGGVALDAEDVANGVDVGEGDGGFGVADAVEGADGSGVVLASFEVVWAVSGIEADGEGRWGGHEAWRVSKIRRSRLTLPPPPTPPPLNREEEEE